MNLHYKLLVILFLFTEVYAQNWENFTEQEKKIYLTGWYGIIEISRVRIAEYIISDQRPTGVCSSPFVNTFSETMDSLSTYHFRPADMDSLIYLIDEILLLNKNRQEVLREAIKYFRRGQNKYDHIEEFEPIFEGLIISENLINSGIKLQNLSLGNAVTAVLKNWGNKYEYDKGVGGEFLWSELDSTEKITYIEGWIDGYFLGWGGILQVASHFALKSTKFQREMKKLAVSGYEEDCIVDITEGMLELSDIFNTLRPNISGHYNKRIALRYALISLIDENIKSNKVEEQTISKRSTISLISESIKNWNHK